MCLTVKVCGSADVSLSGTSLPWWVLLPWATEVFACAHLYVSSAGPGHGDDDRVLPLHFHHAGKWIAKTRVVSLITWFLTPVQLFLVNLYFSNEHQTCILLTT